MFSSDDSPFVSIHFTNKVTILAVIHFVLVIVLFKSDDKLIKIEDTFYLMVMFLAVDDVFTRIVVLDDIVKGPVLPQQP